MTRRNKRRSKQNKLPSIYNGRAAILFLMGLLFGIALITYDAKYDWLSLGAKFTHNSGIGNAATAGIKSCTNIMGPFGNTLAYGAFYIWGLGAFLIPVILMGHTVAKLIPHWTHMRRHFWTSVIFLLITCALCSLHHGLFDSIKADGKLTYSAGGVVGDFLASGLQLIGTLGGTILIGLAYIMCLFFLTDRKLFLWIETWWKETIEQEIEAYSRSLSDKAQRVLKGYQRQPHQKEMLPSISIDNGAEDQFSKMARKNQRPSRKESLVGAGHNAEPSPDEFPPDSDAAAEEDWRKIGEPKILDLSQPLAPKATPYENPARSADPVVPGPHPGNSDLPGKPVRKPATAHEILSLSKGNEPPPVSEEENDQDFPDDDDLEIDDDHDLAPSPTPSGKPIYQPKSKLAPAGPMRVASVPKITGYKLPNIHFLSEAEFNPKAVDSKEELMKNALIMQTTLSQFKIEVKLGDITKGPTITRYELHPAPGIKMEKIASLTNNLAAALQAERINILAPIPGKSSVGIEVPNRIKSMVMMRDLLESEQWRQSKARIPLALGKDVYGKPIVADLADMPHLLIAGATGSGKSVCINSVVASLLFKFRPDELRFVMIDPKVVELQQYNSLPHLVVPVVNDPKKVILALRWVINEMEKRYQIFAKVGVRNIHSFNKRNTKKPTPANQQELPLDSDNAEGFAVELDKEITVPRDEEIEIPDRLSYIVVIIDELADLMLVAPADVEMAIARITQMARAAGIHCIVATQRPSVDVITGVIKANIPCRIAFQVAAKVDSRTILDAMGADKLLGKGDMLYLPPGSAKLIRAQGALITDEEIQSIVDSINAQGKPTYEVEIHQQIGDRSSLSSGNSLDPAPTSGIDEDEELIEKCIDVIRSEKKASVSLMQRRLRLGYTRAARIMDELENRGIVGPNRGAEPREILVDLDGTGADGNPSS